MSSGICAHNLELAAALNVPASEFIMVGEGGSYGAICKVSP